MFDVTARLHSVLCAKLGVTADELGGDVTLEALDVDSLAVIEISVGIHKEFGVLVEETELDTELTVGQLVELVAGKAVAA